MTNIHRPADSPSPVFSPPRRCPPAQADPGDRAERCEARLERIEARFREIEERRGYDAAVKWWDQRWAAYYANCLAP